MKHKPLSRSCLGVIAGLIAFASQVVAANAFTVTTRIYADAGVKPLAQHRILFDGGLVYDLPQIHTELVTVYDSAQQRVTLLDRKTRVQSTISTEDMMKVTAQARAVAMQPSQQEQLGLLASVESDPNGDCSIQYANTKYVVTPKTPSKATVAAEFGRFADLASRLNLVRRLGPPPFARMTLNEHLSTAGQIPSEMRLSIRRGQQLDQFRSTAEVGELTDEDVKSIEEVRGMLTLYREVGLDELPK